MNTSNQNITSVTALDGLEHVTEPTTGEPIITAADTEAMAAEQANHLATLAAEYDGADEHDWREGDGPYDWQKSEAEFRSSRGEQQPPTEGPDYYGHDDTQLLAISTADVLRFRWQMLHPGEELPEPDMIDKHEIKIALETVRQLNDIDCNMRVQIIPDNDVRFLNYAGQIPIPRSVMLIYKSLMFNIHAEGDKVARWGSWWKGCAFVFGAIATIELMILLAR